MPEALRILLLEDNPRDAELLISQLERDGIEFSHRVVSTELEFRSRIADFAPQVILSDFTLPRFDGLTALSIARSLARSTPFIFVSGTIGEERAIEALKSGASDYVLKENLTRLASAIKNAIRQADTIKERDIAEDMLRRSESRLQDIINTSADWIWECDCEGRFTFSNPSVDSILGYNAHSILGKPVSNYLSADDRNRLDTAFADLLRTGAPAEPIVLRWLRADGKARFLERKMVVLRNEDGAARGFRGIDRDITERRRQEMRIMRLNRALQFLSGTNSAIVRIRDRRDLLQEACRLAVQIGGYGMASAYALPMNASSTKPFVHRAVSRKQSTQPRPPSDTLDGEGPLAEALRLAEPVVVPDLSDLNRPLQNREAWLAMGLRSCIALPLVIDGTPVGVIQLHSEEPDVFRRDELALLTQVTGNISFALQHFHKEENAHYLVYFDSLTALANRTLFLQRVTRMIRMSDHIEGSLTLLVLDLTGLTVINDGLGHHAGDLLLQLIAERLKNEFGDSKHLSHLGAGRYAIASSDPADADCSALIERATHLFDEPFVISDQEIRASAKAGIAHLTNDTSEAEQLLQMAQSALEQAKRTGQHYLQHSPDMSAEASARLSLTNRLREIVAEGRFNLAYQPTVECSSGIVQGVEALLRWPGTESEETSPSVFVPMLESLGLIETVGHWVMQRALADVQAHLLSGAGRLKVAVNVSPLQLRRDEFVDEVLGLLASVQKERVELVLEVTESTFLTDPRRANDILTRLRERGAVVAIDDFGTGHSSLKLLSRLPVDVLKIDRSFVRDLPQSRSNYMIVRTTLMLAKALGMSTIAEGVETRDQLDMLIGLGCDSVQGYYILPPASIADLKDWLSLRDGQSSDRWGNDASRHRLA
jgi:PAS domain S-box-containing protein/diguanylate cyclase (GGDEF)-like protein